MDKHLAVQSPKYGKFFIYPNKIISDGNQACIVEGIRESNGEEVVVKLSRLFPVGYSEDKQPYDKTHLLQEANILSQLRHIDGIPAYYGLHRIPEPRKQERVAIIMRRIPGENIQQRFSHSPRKRLTAKEGLQFVRGAAEILHDAHKRNIIHCDLKFSNFMMAPEGLSIVDWGSAQLIDRKKAEQNAKSKKAIVGTIQFMPYEQVTGKALDERADIYALGVVAAILTYSPSISQRYIYTSKTEIRERTRHELIDAIIAGETLKFHLIVPPRTAEERAIQRILYAMTAANKYLRYTSMAEIIADIDKL